MLKIRKKNGKYFLDYTFGPKSARKRRKIYGFSNRQEAEAMKAELTLRPLDQALDFNKLVEMTTQDAIDKYKTTVGFKKSSSKLENNYFKKFTEFFSDRPKFDGKIWSVSLFDMQEFQNWLMEREYTRAKKKDPKKSTKRTMSPSTVNRHFNTYRNFFEHCRMWGFIRSNPCEFLKNLEVDSKRRSVWTPDQCLHVFSNLPEWAREVLLFIAATAARRGEACRLPADKVDLDRGIVILRSKKGRGKIREREVAMTPSFSDFMAEKVAVALKKQHPYVFVNHEGSEISMTYLTNLVRRKAIKLGYKGLTIHGLRHTLLSQLANSGANLNAVRELAGHTNLRTTQIYLHTPVEQIRSALNKLDNTEKLRENLSPKGPISREEK